MLAAQLRDAGLAASAAEGEDGSGSVDGSSDAARRAFELCYGLGSQLAAAQGVLLPAGVDAAARGGHLMRLAAESGALGAAAGASSAAVVAAAVVSAAPGKHGEASASAEAAGAAIDLQQPFLEETALMQGPVAAVAARCAALLSEWPDHPLLTQLAGICERLLALPLAAPLKTALTGLELLLARAQVRLVGTGLRLGWSLSICLVHPACSLNLSPHQRTPSPLS